MKPTLILLFTLTLGCNGAPKAEPSKPVAQPTAVQHAPADTPPTPLGDVVTMEVAKAVMVTVELDYGPNPPSIAQAINDIERRYEPDDRTGRTFAILDAYGEPTPDGKLHMSMHVSSEKPGGGSLVWKRNGEVLWRGKIVSTGTPIAEKQLKIMVDDGKGSTHLLDGSKNPPTVMDAMVNDLQIPLRQYWPDGAEREITFIYSACGCPVKVMAKRVGNATMRTKDTPVIFPDDPAAAQVIKRLMGW